MAGFWLAMGQYHLGEHEEAQQAFRHAVRNWKLTPPLPPEREELLRSLWQEATTLLGASARSGAQPVE